MGIVMSRDSGTSGNLKHCKGIWTTLSTGSPAFAGDDMQWLLSSLS